jgi:thymidylate kinase|nr:MAG TPA: AAA domain protein [Caudoviricetes sp.]
MPIIIEGPDGAGKSTLAKSLAGALDMNILKMTANGGQSAREYEQKLACDGVIIDRCWVSEQVYSDLFGREPRIDHDDAEALTEFCGLAGIPIIVLLPPLHVVISRLNERGDEYADVVCPNIVEIHKRYQEWAEVHDAAIVLEDNNPATAMKEVLKCML